MEKQKDFKEIVQLFKRRKKTFLVAFFSILSLAILVAYILPPVYVSKSTILIEAQQIPNEYVRTSGSSYVEERLSTITQQILSSSKLMEIINQFNLYPDSRNKSSIEEISEKMRNDIKLETISTFDLSKNTPGMSNSSRSRETTVAFRLAYEGSDPVTVQKVADGLASLYLKENIRTRSERATVTADFLDSQLAEVKKQMDDAADKLSALKSAHMGELPEQNVSVTQAIDRLSRDLDQINAQLRAAQQRKAYLIGQLASVEQYIPDRSPRETEMHPDERLDSLRNELINRQTTFTDKHPDIIRLKREIRELEKQLADARKTGSGTDIRPGKKIVNPAYTNLKTQIETATMEISSLQQQGGQVRSQLNSYQSKLYRAPMIEGDYNRLRTDYENARNKYNDLMNKLMEAKVTQGMEKAQHAERFTIIEPASFPEKPDRPNRLKIILTGLFLSLFGGIVLVAAQESLDQSIKTVDDLTRVAKSPVLSVIPFITNRKQISRSSKKGTPLNPQASAKGTT
ncbi:GumC family protein [Syntrophus aciditrophicus]|uniref:Chain length determinant protein, Wzz-like protein n=1 Tax=Syntrophus aciditrophicus (strain SB) TaxID=56780 RepID=Q2LVT5_SYNAS|nr:chain length determinant protein [Syntrophus aciditrophicus]ABC78193.1 Chain length determinant protein, Wzz-like protein [Syntrophus aciditrophicus SB]OPY17563.1 MAG: putative tyrosine-protein kinase in cps region [Syntrophus sp. PtaB.Bin075]